LARRRDGKSSGVFRDRLPRSGGDRQLLCGVVRSVSPAGPAATISTGSDKSIAGHIASLGHEPHQYTIFYVEVEDIGAALAKAESLGGKTIVGPIPIPTGSFAWFSDPGGNTVGLMQPKS
jgi:predicted enzyme related to lactoylglutathione lyase